MTSLNAAAERTKDYARAAALYFEEEPANRGRASQLKILHWTDAI
jgi:hypothetical protein